LVVPVETDDAESDHDGTDSIGNVDGKGAEVGVAICNRRVDPSFSKFTEGGGAFTGEAGVDGEDGNRCDSLTFVSAVTEGAVVESDALLDGAGNVAGKEMGIE
jgi:hypothetical protein